MTHQEEIESEEPTKDGHPSYYRTVVDTEEWQLWGKVAHEFGFDWHESVECGWLSPKHFTAFLKWHKDSNCLNALPPANNFFESSHPSHKIYGGLDFDEKEPPANEWREKVLEDFKQWKRLLNTFNLPEERPEAEGNMAEKWLIQTIQNLLDQQSAHLVASIEEVKNDPRTSTEQQEVLDQVIVKVTK
jgi:hypothetical protein